MINSIDDLLFPPPSKPPSVEFPSHELTHVLSGTKQFLDNIFGKTTSGGISLKTTMTKPDGPFFKPIVVSTSDEALAKIFEFRDNKDIIFGCSSFEGGSKKENVKEFTTVWLDRDCETDDEQDEVKNQLSSFQLPPSYIVCSGKGIHAYWLLNAPSTDFERVESILKGLAKELKGDFKSAEYARHLRVPGSFNHKYDPPKPVEIISANPDRVYQLADFEPYRKQTEQSEPPAKDMVTTQGITVGYPKIPLNLIDEGFTNCKVLSSMRRNATENGRLSDPGNSERDARIFLGNYCLCFENGKDWADKNIFSKLTDYDPSITEKNLNSLHGKQPRCSAMCAEQCSAIKLTRGTTPITFPNITLGTWTVAKSNTNDKSIFTPRNLYDLYQQEDSGEEKNIIDKILGVGEVLVLGGPPKIGKTWLALHACFRLASGTPFYGFKVPEPKKVLYLFAEGSDHHLKKRVEHALKSLPPGFEDNIKMISSISTGGRIKLDDEDDQKGIIRISKDFDVVVIDPYYRFLKSGDENNHSDQRQIQDFLDVLKSDGKSIIMTHHTNKASKGYGGIQELRGAGVDCFADSSIILFSKSNKINLSFTLRHSEPMDDVQTDDLSNFNYIQDICKPKKNKVSPEDIYNFIRCEGEVESLQPFYDKFCSTAGESTIKTAVNQAVKIYPIKVCKSKGNKNVYKLKSVNPVIG
jgi:hypothetical protein